MRLRRIGECEELGHGARIQLIAALGPPPRGECMRVLVGPARRDVGEDSDGDNQEQQHQGIGEAAHAHTRPSAGGCAPVLCAGGSGEAVCVSCDCPLHRCVEHPPS